MSEYQLAAARDAEVLRREVEEATAASVEANQQGDNYVLTTVLSASVLFFGGISTRFRNKGIKVGLLGLGLVAFTLGAAMLIGFPVY